MKMMIKEAGGREEGKQADEIGVKKFGFGHVCTVRDSNFHLMSSRTPNLPEEA